MDIRSVLLAAILMVGLSAGASAVEPPPESSARDVIQLYDAVRERADRTAESFGVDEETCPNETRTAPIVIPVVQNDYLVGYAFATPRFCLRRGVNRFGLDDRMHFVVDRMVREAHRSPYVMGEGDVLEKAATGEALLRAVVEVVGDDRIERLDLLGSDVRYLR
jgi:hypothetical protein